MNTRFKPQAQGGFTLIELIVVIVILGILAATALPKFSGLSGDARIASLNAAKGAMASSASMLHGKWLIKNETPIVVEGVSVTMSSTGYPVATVAGNFAKAAGVTDDYTVEAVGSSLRVSQKNTPSTLVETCHVLYTPQETGAPTITLPTTTKCE